MVGIPLSAVNSLFTPFTQLDNSATKRYKGTGLGLSICKSLVELMGGTIGYQPNTPEVSPSLNRFPLADLFSISFPLSSGSSYSVFYPDFVNC